MEFGDTADWKSALQGQGGGRPGFPAEKYFHFSPKLFLRPADKQYMPAVAQVLGKTDGTGSPSRFRRPQTVPTSPDSPARLDFSRRDGSASQFQPISIPAARRRTFSRRFRCPPCGGPRFRDDFHVRRAAADVFWPFFISAVRQTTFLAWFRCLPCGGDGFRVDFEVRRAAEMVLASFSSSAARRGRISPPRIRPLALLGGKAAKKRQFSTPSANAYTR